MSIADIPPSVIESWFNPETYKDLDVVQFQELLNQTYTFNAETMVYARAAVLVKAARDSSMQGTIDADQASAIMWLFIQAWMGLKGTMKMIVFNDMLYAKNKDLFDPYVDQDTFDKLQRDAKKLLTDDKSMSNEQRSHLIGIIGGTVPFGYSIRNTH